LERFWGGEESGKGGKKGRKGTEAPRPWRGFAKEVNYNRPSPQKKECGANGGKLI